MDQPKPDLQLPAEMTPAIKDALQMMLWDSANLARAYRILGETIPTRAEDEQSWALWKCLRAAIEHGDAWRRVLGEEMHSGMQALKAKAQADV